MGTRRLRSVSRLPGKFLKYSPISSSRIVNLLMSAPHLQKEITSKLQSVDDVSNIWGYKNISCFTLRGMKIVTVLMYFERIILFDLPDYLIIKKISWSALVWKNVLDSCSLINPNSKNLMVCGCIRSTVESYYTMF